MTLNGILIIYILISLCVSWGRNDLCTSLLTLVFYGLLWPAHVIRAFFSKDFYVYIAKCFREAASNKKS